jgi:hypothetical protein
VIQAQPIGHRYDGLGERFAIAERKSAIAPNDSQAADVIDRRTGLVEPEWRHADGDVLIHLRKDAPDTQHNDWTHLRVTTEAEDGVCQALLHLLDHDAVDFPSGRLSPTRCRIDIAAASSSLASAVFSTTPPTSLLCAMPADSTFATTGNPRATRSCRWLMTGWVPKRYRRRRWSHTRWASVRRGK